MAITINTRPAIYSTKGIFTATSDQTEDSTHVNVRVESELMIRAVAVAKKVKPKALTTHDYTEILRTLVGFSTPNPLGASGINDPGKTGSQLVTTLTNYGGGFSTFSATANVLNSALTATSVTATIALNTIAVTKGKVYVLVATGITRTGTPTLLTAELSSLGINTYTGLTTDKQVLKIFIQPRTTGNLSLILTKSAQIGGIGTTTFTMYELNPCDWYVPYYIKFTEKWENASGVTQTGTTTTDSNLFMFFDMPSVTESGITDYTLGSSTKKFMLNDAGENSDGITNYTGTEKERSVNVYNRAPGTSVVEHSFVFLLDNYNCRIKTLSPLYYQNGTLAVTPTSLYSTYYSPILIYNFNYDINYTLTIPGYIYRAMLYIQKEQSDTQISEKIPIILDERVYPELYSIVWKNDKGGYSTAVFTRGIEQDRKSDRVQFKNSTGLKKTIASVNKNALSVKKPLTGSETQLSYLADIVDSKEIYWHRGTADFVPISISKDSMIMKSTNLEYPQIDFEYIA